MRVRDSLADFSQRWRGTGQGISNARRLLTSCVLLRHSEVLQCENEIRNGFENSTNKIEIVIRS